MKPLTLGAGTLNQTPGGFVPELAELHSLAQSIDAKGGST